MSKEQPNVPLPTELQQTTINEPAKAEGNPSTQYFRHPKLQIELPTGGNFWPEGSLELKEGKYLDIMPMTARDEIMMKSPEGLLSGTAMVETISSCAPGIKDPWLMPAHDIDTVLIAIRLASFDHELELTTRCPHCKEVNKDTIDLRVLLDNIPKGQIKNVYRVDDLTLELKPYSFRFVNERNRAKFEQEKLAQTLVSTEMADDEKHKYFTSMFSKLADHNTESLVVAIHKINMPDGTVVTDKNMIKEFIEMAGRDMINAIRDRMTQMNTTSSIQPVTLTCDNDACKKEYDQEVEFNQSNFFE
jgi:hypothetical protein